MEPENKAQNKPENNPEGGLGILARIKPHHKTKVKKAFFKSLKSFVRWSVKMLWRLIKKFALYAFFLFVLLKAFFSPARFVMPGNAVLYYDLSQTVSETDKGYLFADFLRNQQYNLRDLVRNIELASFDERVKALVVKGEGRFITFSQAEELRKAVETFRSTGKRTVYVASDFGDAAMTNLPAYYLASSFSEIWMARAGEVNLSGIYAEAPFFKGTLEKIGVNAEFFARHEYKSGPQTFIREGLSEAARSNIKKVMQDYLNIFEGDVARDRNMTPEQFKTLSRKTPIGSAEALEAGLIDRVGYIFDIKDEIKTEIAGTEIVDGYFYDPKAKKVNKKIAIVYADGIILSAEASRDYGQNFVLPQTFYKLLDMVNDEEIEGVLLRINSPGGSFAPTDEILAILDKVASKVPLVVSMGRVAASGGYMLALPAHKIFASQSSLTGSIGVYGGKFSVGEMMKKIEVSFDEIMIGAPVLKMQSNAASMNEAAKNKFNQSLDRIYQAFTNYVMQYRELSAKEVNERARGRIFTGREAKELGLVDEIGGYNEALKELKSRLEVKPEEQVSAIILPTARDKISMIVRSILYNSDVGSLSDIDGIRMKIKVMQEMMDGKLNVIMPYNIAP